MRTIHTVEVEAEQDDARPTLDVMSNGTKKQSGLWDMMMNQSQLIP